MKSYSYTVLSSSQQTKKEIVGYADFYQNLQILLSDASCKTEEEYNHVLKQIKQLSLHLVFPHATTSSTFKQELALITKNKPLTEQTPWGGVSLKKVDVAKDFIQKLLVIKKDGILGFEIHKEKTEHLTIREGFCLVFFVNRKNNLNTVILQLSGPDDSFDFMPRDAHGILTLTDSIIEETSTNHLDDLQYIFHAK